MAKIFECKILGNVRIKKDCFRMTFAAPQIARGSKAGQFLHLKCGDSSELLLRRPFSIHRVCGNNVEILYRTIGRGTSEIARKKPGEVADAMGPLGNGFEIPKNMKSALLVGGGMGVAPLVMLAEKIRYQTSDIRHQKKIKSGVWSLVSGVYVLIGAKTKNELLCEEEFKKLGCYVKVSTEDGSKGFKGLVTDLLGQLLSTFNSSAPFGARPRPDVHRGGQLSTVIYACGPKPMLERVAKIAREHKMPAQMSLEENMACGIGACYGCPVKTKEGYKLVCKDGPVFKADEIDWE